MSSHCVCSLHFHIYSYPITLASHEWTFHGAGVSFYLYMFSENNVLDLLCVVLICIDYSVCCRSRSFISASSLLFKLLSQLCAHMATVYCTLCLRCISPLSSQLWASWIISDSIGLAEIEKLDISKWQGHRTLMRYLQEVGVHALESSVWGYACVCTCVPMRAYISRRTQIWIIEDIEIHW